MGRDGRPSGEALVGFHQEADWTFCQLKHKQNLGKRYVEVYDWFVWIVIENFKLKYIMNILTPTLSVFKISEDATLFIQNLLVSRLFINIFPRPNFAEELKWQFSLFFENSS